jgi:hypothetical protein
MKDINENNCKVVLNTFLSIIHDHDILTNTYNYLYKTCIYLLNTYNVDCKHIRFRYIKKNVRKWA